MPLVLCSLPAQQEESDFTVQISGESCKANLLPEEVPEVLLCLREAILHQGPCIMSSSQEASRSQPPLGKAQEESTKRSMPTESISTDPIPPTDTKKSDQSLKSKAKPSTKEARLLNSIDSLKAKIVSTESQLSAKTQELIELESFQARKTAATDEHEDKDTAALSHAQSIIAKHISLLTRYNEIKDIAMGMLSLIADKEGRRLAEVMEDRGVSEKD